jgi:hypothetical protein
MKRHIWLLMLISALVLLCATSSLAQFPGQKYGSTYSVGNGSAWMQMYQGWYRGSLAWYICTDTNNISYAASHHITLAPKLTSFINHGAWVMYVVTNFSQGPVFAAAPSTGMPYSGIWRIYFITWLPTAIPRVITSDLALPLGSEATTTASDIVLDAPIVAEGPLGGPWKPAPPGCYRIAQAQDYNVFTKKVKLPAWNVFVDDPITHAVSVQSCLITDTENTTLRTLLQCNLAPALVNAPDADTQRFWVRRWDDPASPPPPCQLPVIEDGPIPVLTPWRNWNYGYSPVMRFVVLTWATAPYSLKVNNDITLQMLWGPGKPLQTYSSGSHINAPVIPTQI